MDRHWFTTVRSLLFRSVKIHDQNTATRRVNSSRRRRSREIRRSDQQIEGRIWFYFAVDSPYLGEFFGTGRRKEKYFNTAWILMTWINSCIRAIQRHSGENFVDPFLQDNILLPSDFAEYIYHVGNAYEMHSIIQSGLILGWKNLKKGQTVSVLHSCEPDWRSTWSKRSGVRSEKTRNRTVQTNIEISSQYCILVRFTASSEKRIAILAKLDRTQSLFQTPPAICLDKVVCMKTREELYCKTYRSPRLPRVTLVPNFQHVRKDLHFPESRKFPWSWKRSAQGNLWQWILYWFAILGIPHSAVEQVWDKSKRKSSTIIWAIRTSPRQEYVAQGLQEIGWDQPLETSSTRQCSDCA